ncbi:DUF1253-domain-containing protein, partial [Hanseniaspora valbyensis NRRL Y-1626]
MSSNSNFKHGRKELRHGIKKIGERRKRFDETNKKQSKKPRYNKINLVSEPEEEESEENEEEDDDFGNEDYKTKEKIYSSLLKLIKNDDEDINQDLDEDSDLEDLQDDEIELQNKSKKTSSEIKNGESSDDDEKKEDELVNDIDSDADDESNKVHDYYRIQFDNYNEQEITKLNEQKGKCKFNMVKYPLLNDDSELTEDTGISNSMVYMKPKLNFDDNKLDVPELYHNLSSYQYKQKLKLQNPEMFQSDYNFTNLQKNIIDPVNQYKDVLYTYQDHKHEKEYRDIYTLHILNHLFKTRDKILKNNYKLSQKNEEAKNKDENEVEVDENDDSFKDQGYNRTKCMIVLPTRQVCYDVLTNLIEKSGIDQVDKINKFKDQFNIDDDDYSLDKLSTKDDDFKHLFKGNTNDFFIVGVKVTRKTLRLYSALDSSDLVLCSPLGLKLLLESYSKPKNDPSKDADEDGDAKKLNEQLGIKGKQNKNSKFQKGSRGKKNTDDFLSSLEIVVLDQFQTFEYQNSTNVLNIMKTNLNNLPQEQTSDMDFGRIKYYYLDNLQYLFRQTLIFTKNLTVNSNLVFNNYCFNRNGRFKNLIRLNDLKYTVLNYLKLYNNMLNLKFQRFETSKDPQQMIISEPDFRFKFFISSILPNLIKNESNGVLIYIPDYTDFLRLKNYIGKNTSLLVDDLNEYSSVPKITKTRNFFKLTSEKSPTVRGSKKINVLLYTERLHYYRKYDIKGIKQLIFYKPPTDHKYFQDFMKMMIKYNLNFNKQINDGANSDDSDNDDDVLMEDLVVRSIYSKLDSLYMNRIVGNKNLGILMSGSNDVYEF